MKIVSENWQKLKPNELDALEIRRQPFEHDEDRPRFHLLSFNDIGCIVGGLVFIMAGILFRGTVTLVVGIATGLLCIWLGLRHVGHAAKVRAGRFDVASGTVTDKREEISHSSDGADFYYYVFVNGVKIRISRKYFKEYLIGDMIELVVVDGIAVGILEAFD